MTIRVSNPEIKTGYLPRMLPCKGAYAGDCIVTCINDKVYIPIVNTLDHEIEILVPTIKLLEIKEISKYAPSGNVQTNEENVLTHEYLDKNDEAMLTNKEHKNTIQHELNSQIAQATFSNMHEPMHTVDQGRRLTCSTKIQSRFYSRAGSAKTHKSLYSRTGSFYTSIQKISIQSPSEMSIGHPPTSMDLPDMPSNSPLTAVSTASSNRNKSLKNNNSPACVDSNKDNQGIQRIEKILDLLRLNHLSSFEIENVIELVKVHHDRFYLPDEYLNKTHISFHKIVTTDNLPINTKQYRFPPIHREEIHKQVNQLLEKEIVKPSTSPYNSPVWIVPKKPDSSGNKRWRMVIDYRRLNEKTVADAYPLPNISDILDQLGGAKYFSILDLASGFHQIPINEDDACKTAFSTPHGHYEFTRMPFGLRNAPATFQRLMDQVLSGLQGLEMFVYMDDIVIYASSLREHDIKIAKLMARLRSANLTLQIDKCEFLRNEVAYLGHIIGEDGLRPDPQKIEAVKNFPVPRNLKGIRQFLGLAGYYRRFIPDFSRIASPLSNLLKKNATFKWSDSAQNAFCLLRKLLCEEPILQFPDFQKNFILTTDASDYAIGGVLSQGILGQDLPVSYASRVLNNAEKNYSTIEKELLSITYCVNHFRSYLYGRKFTLVTDHQPLTWLHKVKDPTSRLMRWRLKLEEYDYHIIYKKGSTNKNADALSRNPTSPSVTHISFFPILKRLRLDPEGTWTVLGDEGIDNGVQLQRKTPTRSPDHEDLAIPGGTPEHVEPLNSQPHTLPSSPEASTHHGYQLRPRKRRKIVEPSSEEEDFDHVSEARRSSSISQEDFDNEENALISDHESNASERAEKDLPPDLAIRGTRTNDYIQDEYEMLLNRDDNLVVMVTADGHPFDKGAQELQHGNKLPSADALMLGRARVYPLTNSAHQLIMLPVKERQRTPLDILILRECFLSLLDVITELNLLTLSLRHTERLDSITWGQVLELLQGILNERPTIITICQGIISTPAPEQRHEIIREFHESAAGGHKGITKTYLRIRKHFAWRNMKRDIEEHIRNCRPCQEMKLVRKKTRQPMVLTDTPGHAFDKVALDIVGPFRRTSQGNRYVLTMQDLLTKYSLYVPICDMTAQTTATAFINYFICRFGCPRSILTDQGTNFVGSLFKVITKKFHIRQFRTTAHHPQSNGSLERSHIVLTEYLKCFVSKERNWDEWIERATFSYNTAVHEGTGYTPHELIFGTPARIPSSFSREKGPETYHAHLSNLFRNIKNLQISARNNLIKAKERSKVHYDKRVNPVTFNVGEAVLLVNNSKVNKFSNEYTGPYLIVECLDHGNVRIQIKPNKTRVVHTNRIKACTYYEPG